MPNTDLNIIAKMTSAQIDAGFKKMMKNLDKSEKGLKKNERASKKAFGNKQQVNLKQMALKIAGVTAALVGMSVGIKKVIEASSEVEGLRIRLEVLFGSAEEGNKVFMDMQELASKVPKTYQEIMQAATALGGVVQNGSAEIKKWMPLIVDLSAATGMGVQDVTGQIIRMYSAGAASADMFRERGVLAMLGFQAGVAVSAEETRKRLIEAWEDPASKFAGASKELANTWEGAMSMMGDALFQLRVKLGDFITQNDDLMIALSKVTAAIKEMPDAIDEIAHALTRLKEINEALAPEETLIQKMTGVVQMTSLQGFIDLIGLANTTVMELAETLLQTEFAQQISAELALPTKEEDPLDGGVNDYETKLEEERLFWEEKAQVAMAGNEVIDMLLKEQADWKKQMREQDKLFFVQNELEKINLLLDNAKLEEKTAVKLDAKKRSLLMAESTLRKKVATSNTEMWTTSAQTMLKATSTALGAMGGESKKFAGIMKGIAIAEAVINTAVAVTNGLKMTPFFPLGIAMGAMAAASGAVQIATIASQGFAEGTDSVPANLTSGEMVIPRSFSNAVRSGDITIGGRGAGQVPGGASTMISPIITIEINNPIVDNDDRVNEIADDIALRVSEIIADEEERI